MREISWISSKNLHPVISIRYLFTKKKRRGSYQLPVVIIIRYLFTKTKTRGSYQLPVVISTRYLLNFTLYCSWLNGYSWIVLPLLSWNRVVCCSGSTLFPGFPERLEKEMKNSHPGVHRWLKLLLAWTKIFVWIGGSASLSTFEKLWLTKAEYSECGSSIVHRKCPF